MEHTTKKKSKKKLKIFLAVIILLVVIRAILPYVVLHYANKSLAEMKGYYGHIKDIDIALYRGAYRIDSIYINKIDDKTSKQTPFFGSRAIDLSVEWKAIFKGEIVGELVFETPKLIFTKDKAEIGDVAKDTADFKKILKDFMPLRINRFEVQNGSIHYTDNTSSTKVDVALTNTQVLAQNLSNASHSDNTLPSTVMASANAYEGALSFNMKLNALAKQPTFDMNAEIKNTNLVLLNDFLSAYGNFDVNKGTFGLYTEFAAKDGLFKGYVKPIIKDLDVLGKEDKNDKFFHKVYEGIVGGVGVIFKNQSKDQVATKVPIQGELKDPSIKTWDAVWQLLRNAFIQALMPSIDQQINFSSVDEEEKKKDKKNIFQKVFSGNKKDKKDNKKK